MRLIDADELLKFVDNLLQAGLITESEADIVRTIINSSPTIEKEPFYDYRLP
jgi:hypothetical protein